MHPVASTINLRNSNHRKSIKISSSGRLPKCKSSAAINQLLIIGFILLFARLYILHMCGNYCYASSGPCVREIIRSSIFIDSAYDGGQPLLIVLIAIAWLPGSYISDPIPYRNPVNLYGFGECHREQCECVTSEANDQASDKLIHPLSLEAYFLHPINAHNAIFHSQSDHIFVEAAYQPLHRFTLDFGQSIEQKPTPQPMVKCCVNAWHSRIQVSG